MFKNSLRAKRCQIDGKILAPVLPELEPHVRDLLRQEETLDPESIYAEVAHVPEGRIGNVMSRPVLRGHESLIWVGREHQATA